MPGPDSTPDAFIEEVKKILQIVDENERKRKARSKNVYDPQKSKRNK